MDEAQLIRAFLAERDIPCPTCAYNLRGLAVKTCPECGLELGMSIMARAQGAAPYSPEVEAARVAEYLGKRSIGCPGCGHALKGHKGAECPACHVRLTLWSLRPQGLDLPGGRWAALRFALGVIAVIVMTPLAIIGALSVLGVIMGR